MKGCVGAMEGRARSARRVKRGPSPSFGAAMKVRRGAFGIEEREKRRTGRRERRMIMMWCCGNRGCGGGAEDIEILVQSRDRLHHTS